MPLIYGLLTYIGWGTGDIFGAIASRKIGAFSTTFWVFAFGLMLFTLYAPFQYAAFQQLTISSAVMSAGLGLFYIAGNLAINIALQRSNASLVGTIAASWTPITLVLSIILFGVVVDTLTVFAMIIIFAGVFLCTIDFRDFSLSQIRHDIGIAYALIAMVSWGTYFALLQYVTPTLGWFVPIYISFLLTPLIYVFMRWQHIPLESLETMRSWIVPVALSAIFLRGADFIFNHALSMGYTAIVAPIAGSYATLFVIIAAFVFKDAPLRPAQRWGIVIVLLGIVVFSVFKEL